MRYWCWILVFLVTFGLIKPLTNAVIVSVSGVSSGGYAAVQYHLSFSSTLVGVGVIAGGPYCANDNVVVATQNCMKYPNLIVVDELVAATAYAAGLLSIDNPYVIKDHKVWLFSGTLDSVVVSGVVKKLETYYKHFVDEQNIATVFNIPAEHSFVTDNYGNDCDVLATPFLSNCKYDTAGAILKHIHGQLNPRVPSNNDSIVSLRQASFMPSWVVTGKEVGLYDTAYAYIPSKCLNGTYCKIHVAFHGCLQTVADVGDQFFTFAGYNEWAESNDFVILYPQAQANSLNPEGCFDWWGYSGVDYATKLGAQMATVKNMVDYLITKIEAGLLHSVKEQGSWIA